ncbi:hypothetical protein KK083_30645 [Fulvivirgaceae bacterium PWU4]|uniref:Fibronectin type-III domain-containing protein n=1 Tax=Chryseosolibacter histidini TaxID=2782349 RepID=A0AAP2DRR0_9BACT|nr:fibrobacter succinogenes major paralogous domain-containing protein [Chryseosolibacter histidini]MBT1701291.1 hypothetical protein [Chryseosolibacter histidini]
MKSTLQNLKLWVVTLAVGFAGAFPSSCDEEEPDTVPTVSTGTVTAITGSTAIVTGEIINDGGPNITASGFVYSSTNATPTLAADSFTEETATVGVLTSQLNGLSSSTTYHVRAYAINGKGTGYGEVVDFTTGNAAPVASAVSINGAPEVNKGLTGIYTYSDSENDVESGSLFKWYVANDGTGAGEVPIAGATAITYTVQASEQGKYIRFGVTPKASTGNAAGEEVKSAFVGPVGEATTVTFTYNGHEVTYGIINSSTGRKWLDRNLGATNAPSAFDDYANYGDLFQWGRLADGHQLVTRDGLNDANIHAINGSTSFNPLQTSSTNTPNHSLFIINWDGPFDWRVPQNNNLWQGVNGINNPCPSGWRVPTAAEWSAENLGTISQAYAKLKITLSGLHAGDDDGFYQSNTGRYWTTTIPDPADFWVTHASINGTGTSLSIFARANGAACRCIKD